MAFGLMPLQALMQTGAVAFKPEGLRAAVAFGPEGFRAAVASAPMPRPAQMQVQLWGDGGVPTNWLLGVSIAVIMRLSARLKESCQACEPLLTPLRRTADHGLMSQDA